MKALVYQKYGAPEVLELRDIGTPAVPDDGLRVRVRAASINARDWYFLTGTPYPVRVMTGLPRPKGQVLGVDFAGTVESVGAGVRQFQLGDEVFGAARGTFAEYARVSEDHAVPKPANLTFEQAAAVPVAGLTALQGLRDRGRLRPGQRVLINGASGGVGTFAVQIAKWLGARVTAVCSTKKVDMVRSIGADDVIDYTREDFTRSDARYDLMFDVAGSRTFSECRRVLTPEGSVIIAGGPRTNPWVGPLLHLAGMRMASVGGSRKVLTFMARMKKEDLLVLRTLLETGQVTPVVDGRFDLSQADEAFRYFGAGLTQGKVVLVV